MYMLKTEILRKLNENAIVTALIHINAQNFKNKL